MNEDIAEDDASIQEERKEDPAIANANSQAINLARYYTKPKKEPIQEALLLG